MDASTSEPWVYIGRDGEIFGPNAYQFGEAYNLGRATMLCRRGEGVILRASDGIADGAALILAALASSGALPATENDAADAVREAVAGAVAVLRARWFTEVFGTRAASLPGPGADT